MTGATLIITSKQMRRARALVKWNLHDLANQTHIPFPQLEQFENGRIRLTKAENDEVISVFERHSVAFDKNGGATLIGKSTKDHELFYASKEFKTYNLDITLTIPVVASSESEGEDADSPEVNKKA
jgi:hypothetical protein